MPTATLTTKGQITIPQPVRSRLGLKAGDRVDFVIEADGRVSLEPRRIPFERLRGILRIPRKRRVSLRDMAAEIGKAVRRRWERVNRRPSA